jgi:predicted DNA-binding protein
MEVHFSPEMEEKLEKLATATGRPAGELVQDAVTGYFEELAKVRTMLDDRYDALHNGQIQPIDGEEAFRRLRERSMKRQSGGS